MHSGNTHRSHTVPIWRANAAELVSQLRTDVTAIESIPPTRQVFGDLSAQYVLLVAFTDIAGCAQMAANTQAPPNLLRELTRPCAQLERAAQLFTRAETQS